MKWRNVYFFIAFFLIYSCSSIPGYQLSRFSINGESKNSWIVDRKPDYGDGHQDGCITMSEMDLKVNLIQNDSVLFQVKDVKTQEPLIATIELVSDHQKPKMILQTDLLGVVSSPLTNTYQQIKVYSVGYRTLIVNLSRNNRL
jgi:hypothetical protein